MSAIAQDMIAQLTRVLASEGMSGEFFRARQVDDPTGCSGVPVRFLLRHPGVRDDAIVNAYGVNAQILTFANAGPFCCEPPEKFDVVVQADGLRYVFDAVTRRSFGDTVIAYTAFVRGKGA